MTGSGGDSGLACSIAGKACRLQLDDSLDGRLREEGVERLLRARDENRKKENMFQKDAIVRLLRDNDPATVALLKDQLIESGSDGVAALRDLLSLDDAAVRRTCASARENWNRGRLMTKCCSVLTCFRSTATLRRPGGC